MNAVTGLPRRVAKAAVTNSVGVLPYFEYRLEMTRWRQARQLHRLEDMVVEALTRELRPIPRAEVATIIPTYRRPESLLRAVDSALSQTVDDHRVLVVDDGGGISATLPADPRLTIVGIPRNIGTAGVVRNVGIRLSGSRLIAFLDDDNEWEPGHLDVALRAHRDGADLSYSGLRRVDEQDSSIDVISEPFRRTLMRERSLVDTNVIVVRRGPDVRFSRVPRRRGDFPLEDWELVWRLSRRLRVVHIPEVTVRYVQHGGSYFSSWGDDATQ